MAPVAIVSTLVALHFVAPPAAPAAVGGGAVWQFDRASYRPGEQATATTGIGWAHNPDLGTPEEGPYHAYVISSALPDGPGPYPSIPNGAVPVGEVEVNLNQARVRFVVPDLPEGYYDLLHCDVPCTTTLADITWGQFVIGDPPPTTTTTTTSTTTTTVAPTTTMTTVAPSPSTDPSTTTTTAVPDGESADEPTFALAVGGGAVAAALLVAALRRRRRSGGAASGQADTSD